jgi:hypothetical protein
MLITRFNVLVLAAVAGGVLWIENAHRVRIEAPAPVEASAQPTQACPANESVPFSPECMAFIQGTYQPAKLRRLIGGADESTSSSELP